MGSFIAARRRRPASLIRNFWVYRRLVALAALMGLILWFVWRNSQDVTVHFPFGLGTVGSTVGVVILASVLVGGLASALGLTVMLAIGRARSGSTLSAPPDEMPNSVPDDLPPADYAKTTDAFAPIHRPRE